MVNGASTICLGKTKTRLVVTRFRRPSNNLWMQANTRLFAAEETTWPSSRENQILNASKHHIDTNSRYFNSHVLQQQTSRESTPCPYLNREKGKELKFIERTWPSMHHIDTSIQGGLEAWISSSMDPLSLLAVISKMSLSCVLFIPEIGPRRINSLVKYLTKWWTKNHYYTLARNKPDKMQTNCLFVLRIIHNS